MPKSTSAELASLREEVFARDGGCKWPGCDVGVWHFSGWVGSGVPQLQLAHLQHRGMGGSKERNTPENCVTLCSVHHDCLDGRTGLGILRNELNVMLRAVVSGVAQ